MIEIKNKKGIVTKIFATTFEHEAYTQIKNLVNFEAYQYSKVRIMPDAHAGKGCTIGTTMTISDKITPNLVGVDIGCGMLTIALNNRNINFKLLDDVIKEYIPHGFNVHTESKAKFDLSELKCKDHVDLCRASLSIGTLGGGNHFIEVSENIDGMLYLIIHSGSRKLGGDICKYYQNKAIGNIVDNGRDGLIKRLKKEGRSRDIQKELSKIKKPRIERELSYLEGKDYGDYMDDMCIAQKYASLNREVMANIIISKMGLSEIGRFETIHNYIDFSSAILRKGAVSAAKGETLLIPINMRDGSLLCIGKGNPDWNYSAPHGAGRLMSRSKAKENIDIDEFKDSMNGVFSSSVGQSTLDEAPQAYKSMEEIIDAIADTADVFDILKPVYNFKSH